MEKYNKSRNMSDLAVFLKFAPSCLLGGLCWFVLVMLAVTY